MNALRLVSLVLAVCVLGIVGWRALAGRPEPIPADAGRLAALDAAMRAPAADPVAPLAAPPAEPAPASAPDPASAPAPAPVADEAAEPLAAVPEFARFYERLKADFPRDYGTLVDRLHAPGASPPAATAVIWDALRDLEQSQGVLAAEADPPALDRFFDARSAVLDGLAPLNARQCVDFLYGVADGAMADFTEAHRGLVATLADRTLDAIADGRSRHLDREPPSPADLDALAAGLAGHGLSPAEIGLLIDGTTPETPLPDARTCEIGRTYLAVLHGLPAESRSRIYGLAAELLARS